MQISSFMRSDDPGPDFAALLRQQGLGPTILGICLQGVEGLGDERNGRPAVNVPVGDEQCPGARVEEGAREGREGIATGAVARRGVARREEHPIGIKLVGRHFRGGKQPDLPDHCLAFQFRH